MGIIDILPEALNIDQAVNIYIFKENPRTFLGILMLYFKFDYDEYNVYGIEYQKDIIKTKFK